MTRYVPILKGKQGEYGALGAISPGTRRGIQPLIEIVPSGDEDDPDVQRADADKAASKLAQSWAASAAFLDPGFFDLGVDVDQGNGMLAYACEQAESRGIQAIPVVRLEDPQEARSDARALHTDYHRGVCLRLYNDDLDTEGDALDGEIQQFLSDTSFVRPDVDLLIDAGFVDGDVAVTSNARAIRLLLRELPQVQDYRSVTVAGGAFPEDLSAFTPWVIGQRQRYDADMWVRLVNRGVPVEIAYGDYAIANPGLPQGTGWRPAPQLRYTVDTEWLVLKGTVNDPRGHSQFYDICDQIAAHAKFAGAALGAADRRVANPRVDTTGNASTWRQVGTTHHLDFVVSRLTNLGEP